jgi:hypothetical protein
VLWVFHAGDRVDRWFITAMSQFCQRFEQISDAFSVYSVMPGTQKQFPGMDFADFLAWHSMQHALKLRVDESTERTPHMKLITCKIPSRFLRGTENRGGPEK